MFNENITIKSTQFPPLIRVLKKTNVVKDKKKNLDFNGWFVLKHCYNYICVKYVYILFVKLKKLIQLPELVLKKWMTSYDVIN